jgi:hypothetical protein
MDDIRKQLGHLKWSMVLLTAGGLLLLLPAIVWSYR